MQTHIPQKKKKKIQVDYREETLLALCAELQYELIKRRREHKNSDGQNDQITIHVNVICTNPRTQNCIWSLTF